MKSARLTARRRGFSGQLEKQARKRKRGSPRGEPERPSAAGAPARAARRPWAALGAASEMGPGMSGPAKGTAGPRGLSRVCGVRRRSFGIYPQILWRPGLSPGPRRPGFRGVGGVDSAQVWVRRLARRERLAHNETAARPALCPAKRRSAPPRPSPDRARGARRPLAGRCAEGAVGDGDLLRRRPGRPAERRPHAGPSVRDVREGDGSRGGGGGAGGRSWTGGSGAEEMKRGERTRRSSAAMAAAAAALAAGGRTTGPQSTSRPRNRRRRRRWWRHDGGLCEGSVRRSARGRAGWPRRGGGPG